MPSNSDIVFASVNLFNLHNHDGHTYSPSKPAFEDEAAYNRRIAWLADRIKNLEADIIGFQELWSVEALRDVFQAAGLDSDYDLVARDAPGLGKPQVAMAVRKDWRVDDGAWIEDFPSTFRFSGFHEKHGAEEAISVSINKFSVRFCG